VRSGCTGVPPTATYTPGRPLSGRTRRSVHCMHRAQRGRRRGRGRGRGRNRV